jgi:16S rRNA (cytosine967-C5)-methyltransferase
MRMKHNTSPNSRAVAAEIVRRWMETRDFPDRLMEQVRADRGFVMEVVYGTVKWKRELEWVLKRCTSRLPEIPLRAHVMVGLQQLLHLDNVEPYAAVNESVEGVKALFSPSQADFTNAVLRRVLREKDRLLDDLRRQPLGVRASHPEELVQRWMAACGAERAAALCAWNNTPAVVVLRVNTARIEMGDFIDRLGALDIRAEPHPFGREHFCVLPRGVAVERVPGYDDGWFVVQDPSTAVAVDLLDPRPREHILDACAAPGGKTVALAQRMGGGDTLTAMDLHEDRLVVLRQNLARMGLPAVRVVQGDMAACAVEGGAPGELASETFDGILLDVPCTNTGVLRRRPDARWRFSAERMKKVAATQRSILDGAASRVRHKGRLVYSTCSLEPEEDEALVAAWVRHHPEFKLVRERKTFPPADGVDGAYAALIVREGAGDERNELNRRTAEQGMSQDGNDLNRGSR